jgi:small redox-active disulfide protein 2
MKKLQILGTGCHSCQKLTMHTEKAAQALGMEYEVEKVTDIDQIMGFGVMVTPALAVDGVVKVMGKVPTVEQLKQVLSDEG